MEGRCTASMLDYQPRLFSGSAGRPSDVGVVSRAVSAAATRQRFKPQRQRATRYANGLQQHLTSQHNVW